jgi:hypothetical protein
MVTISRKALKVTAASMAVTGVAVLAGVGISCGKEASSVLRQHPKPTI